MAKAKSKDIKYPTIVTDVFDDLNMIYTERAKEFLGWQEVEETTKEFLFKDLKGNKIICTNNLKNRPLYMTNLSDLKQTILTRKFKFNGEPIIIGNRGSVLNGQHTLIAVVLAEQERVGENADEWRKFWDEEVGIAKLVVYGVDEDDDVINTMDTCKPRSIADIIYRNPYFAKLTNLERREASRLTENAIKFLWERTKAKQDPYAPRKTHTESLSFLDRHKTLVEAIKFIQQENESTKAKAKKTKDSEAGDQEEAEIVPIDRRVSNIYPPGAAAGLLYLMATSKSDGLAYSEASADDRSEKNLDISMFDKACEFWVYLCGGTPEFQAVRSAIVALETSDDPRNQGGRAEKTAIIIKAWNLWSEDRPLTRKDFRFEKVERYEHLFIKDPPTCGGIDFGPFTWTEKKEEIDAATDVPEATPPKRGRGRPKTSTVSTVEADPTPEEIQKAKKTEPTPKGKQRKPVEVSEESNGDSEEDKVVMKPIKTMADLKGERKAKKPAPNNRLSPSTPVIEDEDDEDESERDPFEEASDYEEEEEEGREMVEEDEEDEEVVKG